MCESCPLIPPGTSIVSISAENERTYGRPGQLRRQILASPLSPSGSQESVRGTCSGGKLNIEMTICY
jgi:hypothetical protein